MKIVKLYSLTFVHFALMLFPLITHADISYTIAPLIIDTKAEPRDIITKTITITNTGAQPVTLFPTVNNISLTEGGTIEEFLPPVMSDRTASLASWIEISRRGIDLPMNGSKTIDLTLRINPNPQPGVYHAFIGFGFGGNQDEAVAQVARGQAPGTIVTVTIEDKKREFLKLSRFIIDRFVTKTGNQAAVYTIRNPGDETLIPEGEIIIYDGKGAEVAALKVNEEGQSIPPGEERQFNATVPTSGLFGKYKAFLSVEYGSAQLASLQDTVFFYVFPLKTILIIFGILAVIVAVLSTYIHRRYMNEEEVDDSEYLSFHVRDMHTAESKEHDIDLKKQQ
jgi:hypothetical protein